MGGQSVSLLLRNGSLSCFPKMMKCLSRTMEATDGWKKWKTKRKLEPGSSAKVRMARGQALSALGHFVLFRVFRFGLGDSPSRKWFRRRFSAVGMGR